MSKKVVYLIILLSIGIMIFLSIKGCYDNKKIKENGVLTTAKIFKLDVRRLKGYCFVHYSYEVNGVNYTHSTKISLSKIIKENLLGNNAPLLYDRASPSDHLILLTKFDYQGTSLKIPDTLKWFRY